MVKILLYYYEQKMKINKFVGNLHVGKYH